MCALRSIGNGFGWGSVYRIGWALLALMLVGAGANAGTSAVPMYTLTDLGMLPGADGSWGTALNDAGQVVGYASFGGRGGSPSATHAFLYSGGALHDLGSLGGGYSEAFGINSRGQIVGESTDSAGSKHAFLYTDGSMHDLGTLGGTGSYATGINAAGQVVGVAQVAGPGTHVHAFLYSDGSMHDLGTFGGSNSFAFAINDAGQVTGEADTSTPNAHAFLYGNGRMQDLGTLPGGIDFSSGRAINNRGQVTGFAGAAGKSGPEFHVFLYSGGSMQDLGAPFGSSSSAGINSAGQIVGQSLVGKLIGSPPTATPVPFLYTGGTAYDLNSLIVNGAGYNVFDAKAINESGQIVAIAGAQSGTVAVLLTPTATAIPLPPAAWAALAALPLLFLGRRLVGSPARGAKRNRYQFLWALLAIALIGPGANAGTSPVPMYTLTDLGILPGAPDSRAAGLNSRGDVVGSSGTQAFLYSKGKMTALTNYPQIGRPWFIGDAAAGINDSGEVVGNGFAIDATSTAWVYSDGKRVYLPGPIGRVYASGINAAGQVVGASWFNRHYSHAFLYSNGSIQDLGTLLGDSEMFGTGPVPASYATAINNAGQIVGESAAGGVGGAHRPSPAAIGPAIGRRSSSPEADLRAEARRPSH